MNGEKLATVERESTGGVPGRKLMIAAAILVACFSVPLYQLARFALSDGLYSHILLIPFVSWYLARLEWERLPGPSEPVRGFAVVCFSIGVVALLAFLAVPWLDVPLVKVDLLALKTASFYGFALGICAWFLGRNTLRRLAYPLGMLAFIVPFPLAVRDGIEEGLQYSSALTAWVMLRGARMPVPWNGLTLHLPHIDLTVAPECSGIHSSLVLFITSILAGYLFLRSPWKRGLLTFAVIPLGILRNAFRIFTIGELCEQIGPQMIHHWIHHRGGPIFFALSLIPFFLLLVWLRKSERPTGANPVEKGS